MSVVVGVGSVALILLVLVDAFEAMILPRRVGRRWRPARLFYRSTWRPWSAIARCMGPGKRREAFLSLFGPLSLLFLLAFWATLLISSFAMLHWSLRTPLHTPDGRAGLLTDFYMSGVTFFTLGFGDVTPREPTGRMLTVLEAGMGFGFLAVTIGYLPVLYQAFSRREASISQLDARAGSPPSAAQVLLRWAPSKNAAALDGFLKEWERWSAELLESLLSFPVLTYYRSQHDNQSWLAALTAILDTCVLVIAGIRDVDPYQAQLTFAMARHAVVDLALVFNTPPRTGDPDRLPAADLDRLRQALADAGLVMSDGKTSEEKIKKLRGMYEPFLYGLSEFLLFAIPPVIADPGRVDNWRTSAWMRRVTGINGLTQITPPGDEHFD